jgi:hypothetical protein
MAERRLSGRKHRERRKAPALKVTVGVLSDYVA